MRSNERASSRYNARARGHYALLIVKVENAALFVTCPIRRIPLVSVSGSPPQPELSSPPVNAYAYAYAPKNAM